MRALGFSLAASARSSKAARQRQEAAAQPWGVLGSACDQLLGSPVGNPDGMDGKWLGSAVGMGGRFVGSVDGNVDGSPGGTHGAGAAVGAGCGAGCGADCWPPPFPGGRAGPVRGVTGGDGENWGVAGTGESGGTAGGGLAGGGVVAVVTAAMETAGAAGGGGGGSPHLSRLHMASDAKRSAAGDTSVSFPMVMSVSHPPGWSPPTTGA